MASLGEPFLLSSYASPQHKPKSKVNAHATYTKKSGSSEGYVTVTAQGDGIHILDPSTLHPVISHTLGPRTHFSCPAVSFFGSGSDANWCTTYAVIESSTELSEKGHAGRTVWIWRESLNVPLSSGKKERKSVLVSTRIREISILESPGLLLLSPNGELTLTDLELKTQHHRATGTSQMLASFLFRRSECSFAPRDAAPGCSILVLVSESTDTKETRVEVVGIDASDEVNGMGLVTLGDLNAEIPPDTISSITCSPTGHLTIFTQTGIWHTYYLSRSSPVSMTRLSEPITLSSSTLTFPSTGTLALTSSHVLLCTLAPSTQGQATQILLLLWDVAYSVVLASHSYPLPSALARTEVEIALAGAGSSMALLTLLPRTPQARAQTQARSMILLVPYVVPAASTIAHAMGRHAVPAPYISLPSSNGPGVAAAAALTPSQISLLDAIRTTLSKGDPSSASGAFLDIAHASAMQDGKEKAPVDLLAEQFVGEVMQLIWRQEVGGRECELVCPIVFEWFLEKGAVSRYSMVGRRDTGQGIEVVQTLISGGHINLLPKAVQNIPDVSEDDILQSLSTVISAHVHTHNDDSMQVDSIPVVSLEEMLSSCVCAPWSSAPLRLAIHRNLKDPDALARLLEVMVGWVEQSGLDGGDENRRAQVPPVSKTLAFLQCFLDAKSLTLLSYAPVHALLRRLSGAVRSLTDASREEERLRMPLEAFVKKANETSKPKDGSKAVAAGTGDWRKKRREKEVGWMNEVYRVEELVL